MNVVDRIREYLDREHVNRQAVMDDGWARRSVLVVGPWVLDEMDKFLTGGPFGFPRGKVKADVARGVVVIHGLKVVFDPDERSWRVDEFCIDTGYVPGGHDD